MRASYWQWLALTAYVGLIILTLLWEGWLAPAPLMPPGFWLLLKAVPLLFPLFGLLHGKSYTFAWASMLILAYFAEGLTIAFSKQATWTLSSTAPYAVLEAILSLWFFIAAIGYIRRRAHETRSASVE